GTAFSRLARQALLPPQPEVLDIKIWRVFWVDGHGLRPVRRRGLRVNGDAVAVAVLLLQGRDVRCIISVGVYAHRRAGVDVERRLEIASKGVAVVRGFRRRPSGPNPHTRYEGPPSPRARPRVRHSRLAQALDHDESDPVGPSIPRAGPRRICGYAKFA